MTAAKLRELEAKATEGEWLSYLQSHSQDFIKLMEAAELMAEVSDENCRFDSDGYCQSHNLDHQMDGCRVAKLRQALAAFKEKNNG